MSVAQVKSVIHMTKWVGVRAYVGAGGGPLCEIECCCFGCLCCCSGVKVCENQVSLPGNLRSMESEGDQ